MGKGLFIIIGEAFRSGGQGSRERGHPESYTDQKKACKSHMDLFTYIKNTFEYDCDVYINSYTTIYDGELLNWYGDRLKGYSFHSNPIGYTELYMDSIKKCKCKNVFDEYTFVHFLRIDLFIKEFFYTVFQIDDYIKYSFICWLKFWKLPKTSHPRVADMMMYVPKSCFRVFDLRSSPLHHDGWQDLEHAHLEDRIRTYIKTYHDSDTEKDWNPIYTVVNRPSTENWSSRGYEINNWKHCNPKASSIKYDKI